jgi:hypothetical protein
LYKNGSVLPRQAQSIHRFSKENGSHHFNVKTENPELVLVKSD